MESGSLKLSWSTLISSKCPQSLNSSVNFGLTYRGKLDLILESLGACHPQCSLFPLKWIHNTGSWYIFKREVSSLLYMSFISVFQLLKFRFSGNCHRRQSQERAQHVQQKVGEDRAWLGIPCFVFVLFCTLELLQVTKSKEMSTAGSLNT